MNSSLVSRLDANSALLKDEALFSITILSMGTTPNKMNLKSASVEETILKEWLN